jgi:hypothetical protein
MAIWAQSGYGRGDKIDRGFAAGVINGVILSPRDESPGRLEGAARHWKTNYPDVDITFDPQFYAATMNNPSDGCLPEYDYYANNSGLGRTQFSSTRIRRRYVEQCIGYQFDILGDSLTHIISPTVLFDDFRDSWSQVAINMSVESVDYHASLNSELPLLISIVVSETAFHSQDAMEEFLDALTELDVDGFYIIVRRNATSLQHAMEPSIFGRFLYMCYVLTEINEYKVVVGYSDWHSFLLASVGVSHTACGWYQNLRQFTMGRFSPSRGGRRPRKRYSSRPLLSCPLLIPEMQDIFMAGFLNRVLSGTNNDYILSNGPATGEPSWTDASACLTHWECLHSLAQRITAGATPQDRIQEAVRLIGIARVLYTTLRNRTVNFDPLTGPNHLQEWLTGLQEFRGIARI